MKIFLACASFLLAATGAGCSRAAEESGASDTSSVVGLRSQIVTTTIPGYIHERSDSKFDVGSNVTLVSLGGVSKWTGDRGIFVLEANGHSMGIPSANAPPAAPGASMTFESHRAFVRSYFVGAGLPEDQIFSTVGGTRGRRVASDQGVVSDTITGFSSTILRQVNGIRVVGSFATAQADDAGNVISEDVYWPAVDSLTVTSALALVNARTDSIRQRYPAAVSVEAVIRHTGARSEAAFAEFAVFDVTIKSLESSYVLHVDAAGEPIVLPDESVTGADAGQKARAR